MFYFLKKSTFINFNFLIKFKNNHLYIYWVLTINIHEKKKTTPK